MRYWTGLTLFALTSPLWLPVFVICFAWKVGESMAEYILDDTLAEKYKLWKAANGDSDLLGGR